MGKTAVILGATGLTGSCVLEQLLAKDEYTLIKLFSRKTCGLEHPKLEEHLGDLFQLEQFSEEFVGDELYVCIGTTKKKTPNTEMYRKIDIGIPVQAANLAKINGIKKIAVVSAIGANDQSSIPYNKIKGEMEKLVVNAEVEQTFILRPSFIAGNRKEQRWMEQIGLKVFKLIQVLFIGKLKKYRAVEASDIAKRMIALCNSDKPSSILESNEIAF